MFAIDSAFESTSEPVGDLDLCHVRLQGDARFPWLVLIPRVGGATELEHLNLDQRVEMMDEIVRAGLAVRAIGDALGRPAPKLNVGQLGNVTPQLHVHVVARRNDDAAWPGPVWGRGQAQAYAGNARELAMAAARWRLGL